MKKIHFLQMFFLLIALIFAVSCSKESGNLLSGDRSPDDQLTSEIGNIVDHGVLHSNIRKFETNFKTQDFALSIPYDDISATLANVSVFFFVDEDGHIPAGEYTYSNSGELAPFTFGSSVLIEFHDGDDFSVVSENLTAGLVNVDKQGDIYSFKFNLQFASGKTFSGTSQGLMNYFDNHETPVIVIKHAVSATLGNYLTDEDGNALYFFADDANGANNCTGGCIADWPIFNIEDLTQEQLDSGLELNDFSTITSVNGKQLTFKGWPLYYYAPGGVHEGPGQIKGNGFGGVWFVAKPD